MIAIVNYQASNLRSVKKALDFLGYESEITTDPAAVRCADKVVLPGVGHFAATEQLTRTGLRDAIAECVRRGTPFLGICVGLQWMFEASEEAPQTPGLALFSGTCKRFPPGAKVPHVGWNSLDITQPSRLLAGVAPGAFVYYTHSYRAPVSKGTVATTDYEGPFTAVVERDNVFGVQFHPEKSSEIGLRILKNFGDLEC
ncbi:MAG: imidazole glycerol phosphate synthase subunit HisH [Terriglobales bacterium]